MKKYLRFFPAAAIMGIIFYLSHQPGDMITLPAITGIDKAAHAAAYALLAASLLYGFQPFSNEANRPALAVGIVLFCMFFGLTDEIHQSLIPGRFASIWDLAADIFGGALVVCIWYVNIKNKRPG